jgi:hypothetical protein
MPRKKPELNIYQQFAAEMPPYDRIAGRILFGEFDQIVSLVAEGQAADGSRIGKGYETEPVTDPVLTRWIDALLDIDKRSDKSSLIALLDSDLDLPRITRIWIADLLTRYRVTTRKRPNSFERSVLILLPLKDDPEAKRELVDDLMVQRERLARMFERFDFARPSGGQPVAAYAMTDDDEKLHARFHAADQDVKAHIERHGLSVERAVDRVANEYFPPVADEAKTDRLVEKRLAFADGLEDYHRKLHASSRRMEKRRKY